MKKGKVLAVNTSEKVGEKKTDVGEGMLLTDYGVKGDAQQVPVARLASLPKRV